MKEGYQLHLQYPINHGDTRSEVQLLASNTASREHEWHHVVDIVGDGDQGAGDENVIESEPASRLQEAGGGGHALEADGLALQTVSGRPTAAATHTGCVHEVQHPGIDHTGRVPVLELFEEDVLEMAQQMEHPERSRPGHAVGCE